MVDLTYSPRIVTRICENTNTKYPKSDWQSMMRKEKRTLSLESILSNYIFMKIRILESVLESIDLHSNFPIRAWCCNSAKYFNETGRIIITPFSHPRVNRQEVAFYHLTISWRLDTIEYILFTLDRVQETWQRRDEDVHFYLYFVNFQRPLRRWFLESFRWRLAKNLNENLNVW